jgi:hypothetical protein
MAGRVTPRETIDAIQDALRIHGLPGGTGLDRTTGIITVMFTAQDQHAAPAAGELLALMGCGEVTVLGDTVTGRLNGHPLAVPPVHVHSSDAASSAESAGAAEPDPVKRCFGPCGEVMPVTEFNFRNKARGLRLSYCRKCDAERAARLYRERRERERFDRAW